MSQPSAAIKCPSCFASYKLPLNAEGRQAKCKKCGERFVVRFKTATQIAKPKDIAKPALHKNSNLRWLVVLPIAIVLCYAGYFFGRRQPQENLAQAEQIDPDAQETLVEPEPEPIPEPEPVSELIEEPEPVVTPVGEADVDDDVGVAISNAVITTPPLLDPVRDKLDLDTTPRLLLFLQIVNFHERKLVQFRRHTKSFLLHDDVGNLIRTVDYGTKTLALGEISDDTDINPGESAVHIVAFVLPPPKTESLILSVDREWWGGKGTARLELPVSSIQRKE
jgi:hypothetical protein